MQQTTVNGITVTYPDAMVPIFNRNTVHIDGVTKEVLVVIRKDGSEESYEDVRTPYNNIAEVDISPYLHPFFANALSTALSQNVSFTLEIYTYNDLDERVQLLSEEFIACYAGIPSGEEWGWSPRQRYYANILEQQAFSFLGGCRIVTPNAGTLGASNGIQSDMIAALIGDRKSAEIKFEYPNGKELIHRFIRDERTCGELILWLDYQCFVRYFVFDKGDESVSSKDEGVTIYTPIRVNGVVSTEVLYGRPQGASATKSIKMCATFTDEEDRKLLETLLTAPMIFWYKRSGEYTETVYLRLKRGTMANGSGCRDVEFEFELPYLPTMLA